MSLPSALALRIRELGATLDPAALSAVQELFMPLHQTEPYPGLRIARDVPYGANERQRLDLFTPEETSAQAPVLVFVHGGGYVAGNKRHPGLPYHDNIALWAVKHGLVAANITYRLAPAHRWPAAADDVGLAIRWLRENIRAHGGDPDRIYIFGTSAGAAHVASWLALAEQGDASGVAGAILLSGFYDLEAGPLSPNVRAYFGEDSALYRQRSSLHGLVGAGVPLLVGLAEFDPPPLQRQAILLVDAFQQQHGRWPEVVVRLATHNHFSGTASLNAVVGDLDRELLRFMRLDETEAPAISPRAG